MKLILTAIEIRILGCLIEKQATTPDVYPLTLNSLLSACNQKSNREPVMDLAESELLEALDSLKQHSLASIYLSGRSRAAKYEHKLQHRAFDEFNFSRPQLAVLCVLFLRGPQTPGEIRSRSARIHEFSSIDEVNGVLQQLEGDQSGPYVKMLARQAGRKESRFCHLFCGEQAALKQGLQETFSSNGANDSTTEQKQETSGTALHALEQEVRELKESLSTLEQRFDDFIKQFE